MQWEPELHLDAKERQGDKKSEIKWGITSNAASGKKLKGKHHAQSIVKRTDGGVEADEFFGDDNDEEAELDG